VITAAASTVFLNSSCLSIQERFERFKQWRFLAQAVQARKYFSDGLQAGLQADQAMLISGNCQGNQHADLF
jgi:4-alpha-glucanotransferase